MKKRLLAAVLALVLTGCSAPQEEQVFETLGDMDLDHQVMAIAEEIHFDLPEGAASEAMAAEDGSTVYSWDDFEVCSQALQSGDLERTLEAVTGMDADDLTVMTRDWNGMKLYQTVWCAAAEEGIRTGRAVIADDGNYHYCVSLTAPEEADADGVYDQIVSSFRLGSSDTEK